MIEKLSQCLLIDKLTMTPARLKSMIVLLKFKTYCLKRTTGVLGPKAQAFSTTGMSSFMSSLASLYKRVSIRSVPWRERMGKKGVPVRMNSEKKKKQTSRVAIRTASRQIKWQKKVTSWNLNCYCYWLPLRQNVKNILKFQPRRHIPYNSENKSRGLYFSKALFQRGLFLERLVFRGAYIRMENCVSKSAQAYTWREICVVNRLEQLIVGRKFMSVVYRKDLLKLASRTQTLQKRSHAGILSRYGPRKSKPRVKTELRSTQTAINCNTF